MFEKIQEHYYIERELLLAYHDKRELVVWFSKAVHPQGYIAAGYRGMQLYDEHLSDWDVATLPAACFRLVHRVYLGE